MYSVGSTVTFLRAGCPFLARVVRDDPERQRALLRITAGYGEMQTHSLITSWVPYSRITREHR